MYLLSTSFNWFYHARVKPHSIINGTTPCWGFNSDVGKRRTVLRSKSVQSGNCDMYEHICSRYHNCSCSLLFLFSPLTSVLFGSKYCRAPQKNSLPLSKFASYLHSWQITLLAASEKKKRDYWLALLLPSCYQIYKPQHSAWDLGIK